MPGLVHDGFGDQRDIFDIAHSAYRSGASGGTVHAAGVEFDDAFFVGQASEADAGVVGIVFGTFDYAEGGVEGVASVVEEGVGVVEVVEAVVGGDHDRCLVRGWPELAGLGMLLFIFLLETQG